MIKKHSRKLLLSRYINLNEEQREELNYILINYSEELRRVYNEKEELLDIIHSNNWWLQVEFAEPRRKNSPPDYFCLSFRLTLLAQNLATSFSIPLISKSSKKNDT